MNPYAILGGTVLVLLAIGAAGVQGYRMGRDAEVAARAREEAAIQAATDEMRRVVAESIAKVRVVNQTINREVQREILREPVYTDCRVPDDGMQLLERARTGAEPGSDSGLPDAAAAR
jgi:hypothetical protein